MHRQLFLGFIRVHILYYASKESNLWCWDSQGTGPAGYYLSPDTLYPTLAPLGKRRQSGTEFKCIRFNKNALKERPGLFRLLNSLANPVYDPILERIVSSEEVGKAKAYASASTEGQLRR